MLVLDKSVNLEENDIYKEDKGCLGTNLRVDEENHIYINCDDCYYDYDINYCVEQLYELIKAGKIKKDDKKMWEDEE